MTDQIAAIKAQWAATLPDLTQATDGQIRALMLASAEESTTGEMVPQTPICAPYRCTVCPPARSGSIAQTHLTPPRGSAYFVSGASLSVLQRVLPLANYLEHAHGVVSIAVALQPNFFSGGHSLQPITTSLSAEIYLIHISQPRALVAQHFAPS